jgi:hypothetical protein
MDRVGVPYLELVLIWNMFDRYIIGGYQCIGPGPEFRVLGSLPETVGP